MKATLGIWLSLACLLAAPVCFQPRLWLPLSHWVEGCLLYFSFFSDSAMSTFLENSSTIAHAFSVGSPCVLSSIHFSFLFTPQMVSSIRRSLPTFDMLGILKSISPSPISLQSLDLCFYYSPDISMDMSIWTQCISPTSWIPILVTFTIYIGSSARNIYGLKSLPKSYYSADQIHSTPTTFLEFSPSPLCLCSSSQEHGIWSQVVLGLNPSSTTFWLCDRRVI